MFAVMREGCDDMGFEHLRSLFNNHCRKKKKNR